MAQRKKRKKINKNSNRTRTVSVSPEKKVQKTDSETTKKSETGNIKWVLLAFAIIAVGIIAVLSVKGLYKNTIAEGVSVDGIDLSGMTVQEAYDIVELAAQQELDKISVTFRYNSKSWHYGADELQAVVNVQEIVDKAFEMGHDGSFIQRYKDQKDLKSLGTEINTSITINKTSLIEALNEVKDEIDNPMVETSIDFNPEGYDFFLDKSTPDVDMSKTMFTITEGHIGYEMDYDSAAQQLNEALAVGWTADIELTAELSHPKYSVEELEECTTLVFHSSSRIANKTNANRTHNIEKAIGFYKGRVVWPGETVSYNETLGERTLANGWLEAPTITQDKVLEDALGGGICQASTTIFNAVFMAGAKVVDHGPHSWPAYYLDFGYGMDAMVNWGTDDFIFVNDSEYPMFINTYFWYDTNGLAGYVDVDVYTMPQKDEEGNILHIIPDCVIEENTAPAEPEYRVDTENLYAAETWTPDYEKGVLTFTYRLAKNTLKVRVYKVWYKDATETELGVWEGGTEVAREESHFYVYKGMNAIIYTKPLPTPAPVPSPTITPTPTTTS